VQEFCPVGFTECQKLDYTEVDKRHFQKIQNEICFVVLDLFLQFLNVFRLKAPNQTNGCFAMERMLLKLQCLLAPDGPEYRVHVAGQSNPYESAKLWRGRNFRVVRNSDSSEFLDSNGTSTKNTGQSTAKPHPSDMCDTARIGLSMTNVEKPERSSDRTQPALQSGSQTLSREAVLDALKMMLLDAPLNEVLRSLALLIEAQSEGMLCSIFLLEPDGLPRGDGRRCHRSRFRIVRHGRIPA
jgi:hypothetical protein